MKKWLFSLLSAACMAFTAGCSQPVTQPDPTPQYTLEIVDATTTNTTTSDATTTSESTTSTSYTETTLTTNDIPVLETTVPATTSTTQTTKATTTSTKISTTTTTVAEAVIDKNGTYTSKEDVALYIHTYGELPQNFISKKDAEKLGWTGGSLEPYAPGKCIGGSNFGNYEGHLPTKKGRKYTECDIDTLGKKSRGAKRIVFSNDGLIYYTDDHYNTFTLLYGEE